MTRQDDIDAEARRLAIRAALLELHDNLVDTLSSDCFPLLESLELYHQAALLKERVEEPLVRGDYSAALTDFRQFIADRNVYRTHVFLLGEAGYERMLAVLATNAAAYGVPE